MRMPSLENGSARVAPMPLSDWIGVASVTPDVEPPLPLGEGGGEGCVRDSNVREDTHPSPALRAASPRGRGVNL